jgi:hypothetical protein
MHRHLARCAWLALLLTFWTASAARADEKVPLDKLPKPVLDAVKSRYPGAELLGGAKENEGGMTIYEVTLKHHGRRIDASLRPDGGLISVEKEMMAKELPARVAKAMKRKYPKAKVKRIEEETKDEKVSYEMVLITADGAIVEAVFDPQGKLVKEERKGKKKEK